MIYLKEEDLHPGALVKVYLGAKFEGYGVLIEQCGEPQTYMMDFEDIIFAKCRWLIRWADIKEVSREFKKDKGVLMTQEFLSGNMTHRYVHYIAARSSWETYAKINGGITDGERENTSALNIDDSNFIF